MKGLIFFLSKKNSKNLMLALQNIYPYPVTVATLMPSILLEILNKKNEK